MNRVRSLITVTVVVFFLASCTPAPMATPVTSITTSDQIPTAIYREGTAPVTQKPAPGVQNQCLIYDDPNYPDHPNNWFVKPGERFVKQWNITNKCTVSTKGWKAVKVTGEFGPNEIELPEIAPGQRGVLSQEFTAPNRQIITSAVYRVLTAEGLWSSGFWVDIGVR